MTRTFIILSVLIGIIASASLSSAELVTYPPYSVQDRSPDYQVTLKQGRNTVESFCFMSQQQRYYDVYDYSGKKTATYDNQAFKRGRDMTRHSATIFSFGDGPVTVRIKILSGAKHISLPLTDAKVLPTSARIGCRIAGGDTIIFTLREPRKVAVVANWGRVWEAYSKLSAGHIPLSSHRNFPKELKLPTYHGKELPNGEGYRNPLLILSHPLESISEIPNKKAPGTLVVMSGRKITQQELNKHDKIWFEPGTHDISRLGTYPTHMAKLHKNQTVYLEGGSCVYGQFECENVYYKGSVKIWGRGIISGLKNLWITDHRVRTLVAPKEVKGITVTNSNVYAVGVGTNGVVDDIAIIGAWHPNTDGVQVSDGSRLTNSFLMSDDDNLGVGNNSYASKCVVWHGWNAHPINVNANMDWDFKDTVVEDVDVVSYWARPVDGQDNWARWANLSDAVIGFVRSGNSVASNFVFRDIRIESPYILRLATVYSINSGMNNPGWLGKTSESKHSRLKNIRFENIQINAPLVLAKSIVGSDYPGAVTEVLIKDLRLNKRIMTSRNLYDFFEVGPNLDKSDLILK